MSRLRGRNAIGFVSKFYSFLVSFSASLLLVATALGKKSAAYRNSCRPLVLNQLRQRFRGLAGFVSIQKAEIVETSVLTLARTYGQAAAVFVGKLTLIRPGTPALLVLDEAADADGPPRDPIQGFNTCPLITTQKIFGVRIIGKVGVEGPGYALTLCCFSQLSFNSAKHPKDSTN